MAELLAEADAVLRVFRNRDRSTVSDVVDIANLARLLWGARYYARGLVVREEAHISTTPARLSGGLCLFHNEMRRDDESTAAADHVYRRPTRPIRSMAWLLEQTQIEAARTGTDSGSLSALNGVLWEAAQHVQQLAHTEGAAPSTPETKAAGCRLAASTT